MRFVDLCSGIGGFRLGLEALGHECVFACEIDKHAREAYAANFRHLPEAEDVMALEGPEALPDHELVCCGFPCRTFSRAGRCECDLSLIEHIVTTLCGGPDARTRYLMLENTSTFPTVGGGAAYRRLIELLGAAGFNEVRDAVYCVSEVTGLPQPRKRWVCVAAKTNNTNTTETQQPLPQRPVVTVPPEARMVLKDVLRPPAQWAPRDLPLYRPPTRTYRPRKPTQKICWVGSRTSNHKQHTKVFHRLGLGYTLTGSGKIYVLEPKRRNGQLVDRILSPKEMTVYMGFPNRFRLPNRSRLVATKLLGRAVPPLLVQRVAESFPALASSRHTGTVTAPSK